jgi:hypothetical protein
LEKILIEYGFKCGKCEEGSIPDHRGQPFCKNSELLHFHYPNDPVMDLCVIIIYKAMLTFQIASAHRLNSNVIWITCNILPDPQLYPPGKVDPRQSSHLLDCDVEVFQHAVKI